MTRPVGLKVGMWRRSSLVVGIKVQPGLVHTRKIREFLVEGGFLSEDRSDESEREGERDEERETERKSE